MMANIIVRRTILLMGIIGGAIAVSFSVSNENLTRSTTNSLSPRLQNIFTKSKQICFGRFLMEVPASATVVFGRMTVDEELFRIPGQAEFIEKHVNAKLERIAKSEYINMSLQGQEQIFGKTFDGGVLGQKTIVGAQGNSYNLYSFVPLGKDLFLFESKGGMFKVERAQREISFMQSIALRLQPLGEYEIPSQPGICLDHAFVNMDPKYENISLGVRFAEFPDVHLSIDLMKNQGSIDESLRLDHQLRQSAEDARREGHGAWYSRIRLIRQGPRKIGNWDGQEALSHQPAQEGDGEKHEFVFQAVGDQTDPMSPQAKVELFTGVAGNKIGGQRPSLSDAEAVALWDKMTGSIRARPITPKAADVGPPALGTMVFAGRPCPQEGWWDCGEEANVEVVSGRRHFFRLRDAMPQAVLFRRPTLLQRIGSDPKTFQLATPTMWTLAAYDTATLEKIAAVQTGVR